MYLPFRPIKGQAFTLYFKSLISNSSLMSTDASNTSRRSSISKDGGALATTTNSVNKVTDGGSNLPKGNLYITLTASEMTADVIVFSYNAGTTVGTTSTETQIVIYTTPDELTTAPTLNSSMAEKITAIFQYLFFKRTVTASQEKLYKADNTTLLATGTVSDDSTTFTKGKPV